MKSLFLISALALLSSCGRIDVKGQGSVGGLRSFSQAALSATDASRLQQICASLAKKQQNLSANTSSTYSYSVATRTCESSDFGANTMVDVAVEQVGSGFKYRRVDNNSYFVFPDVETTTSGIMKDVCSNLAAPVSPILDGSGVAIWFSTTDVDGQICPGKANELCIKVEKGVPSGTSYEVVSVDTMRFRVDVSAAAGSVGFFTLRNSETNTSCGAGKSTETRATLK